MRATSSLSLGAIALVGAAQACEQHTTVGAAFDFGGAGGGVEGPPSVNELTTAACLARATCGDTRCSHDVACALLVIRPSLRTAMATCLADDCNDPDTCRARATAEVAPSPFFGRFHDICLEAVGRCPADVPATWCELDALADDRYGALSTCVDLPCAEVLPCLRTAAFADAPQCTSP